MRPRTVKLAARRVALVAACWMALLQAPALLGGEAGARVAQANHVCGHAQAAECTPTATAIRTPTRTPVITPVPTAAPASATPTQAPVATPTTAPTSAPTQTVTAVAGSPTATATATALAGSTVTATVVVAATATPTGEAASPTPVVTATQPAATATPLPTASAGDRRALTVSGGAPGEFSATLNGSEQQVFTTLEAYTVHDGTNRADGWNLTVQAAAFTCAPGVGACPLEGDSLSAGSLFMAPAVVSCAQANRCSGRAAPPVVSMAGAVAIDVPTAVRIASAVAGTGDGTYVFTPASLDGVPGHHLRLTLPASAYATTYGSTLTFTVAVGP